MTKAIEMLTHEGKTLPVWAWAQKCGVSRVTILKRLSEGATSAQALERTRSGQKRVRFRGGFSSVSDIARTLRMTSDTVRKRSKDNVFREIGGHNARFSYNGESLTISEWAARANVSSQMMRKRIRAHGGVCAAALTVVRRKQSAPLRTPDPWESFSSVGYDGDDFAWYVVACHPEGLDCEQIGKLLGVTRERVRQILHDALSKVRHAPEAVVLRSQFAELCSETRETVWPEPVAFAPHGRRAT